MKLPKSKSWIKARYVVCCDDNKEPILCRYDSETKSFKRFTRIHDGGCSWGEWVTVRGVVKWVRVDNLENYVQ